MHSLYLSINVIIRKLSICFQKKFLKKIFPPSLTFQELSLLLPRQNSHIMESMSYYELLSCRHCNKRRCRFRLNLPRKKRVYKRPALWVMPLLPFAD